MGVDVVIYIRVKDSSTTLRTEDPIIDGEHYKIDIFPEEYKTKEFNPTHRIDTCDRYYGPCYERGPFCFSILPRLLNLLNSPDVDKVWYGGDCSDSGTELTRAYLFELINHWIDNGERPYRKCELVEGIDL